ncbi:MAG: hypothetical protein LAN37_02090 [Acidobacteriia bacterium]|nr:hypothetical protein [Terriglobia bacterium]
MCNWKRAVVLGSLGAGAVMAVTGRRAAGAVLAGVGLAVLASEHAEKLEQVWERAPEYVHKTTQVLNLVSGFLERLSEYQQRRIDSSYVV